MKLLILGALLGLLLVFPQLLAAVAVIVTAVLSKPLIVAFSLGLAAGLRMRGMRRPAR